MQSYAIKMPKIQLAEDASELMLTQIANEMLRRLERIHKGTFDGLAGHTITALTVADNETVFELYNDVPCEELFCFLEQTSFTNMEDFKQALTDENFKFTCVYWADSKQARMVVARFNK